MTIIKEIFHNMFFSGKPVFRIDKDRYAHTRKEFPELANINSFLKIEVDGFETDKRNMHRDILNVINDLSRAFDAYKKEKSQTS